MCHFVLSKKTPLGHGISHWKGQPFLRGPFLPQCLRFRPFAFFKSVARYFSFFFFTNVLACKYYIDQNIKNKDTRSQTLILFHGNSGIDKNKILSKETWINVYVTLWRIKWAKSVSQTSLSFLTIESSHDS